MEVQKSKSTEESVEDLSDYYISRKLIDTKESHYLKIYSIGITEDDIIAIKSKIQGQTILIKLGKFSENTKNKMDICYFLNNIFSPGSIYDEEDILDVEFKAFFSDDLKKLGIKNKEYMYDIDVVTEDYSMNNLSEDIFDKVFTWNSYIQYKINKSPWIHTVSDITKLENKGEFSLSVEPTDGYKITWNLDIPFQSDINSNRLAQLIEREGFGDPCNLEDDGEVVVIHKTDLDEGIQSIGLDESQEWALLTKQQAELIDYTPYPSLMETLDYCGNTILMGLMTIVMGTHLISIVQASGFQNLYLPVTILFLVSALMTFFLLDLSTKLPRQKLLEYI